MSTIITKHGKQRLKERAGLRGEAARKDVQRALEHGLTMKETDGKLYQYLAHLFCTHGSIGHMRIYNYKIYAFDEDVFITVYPLPRQYANAFERARKRKQESHEKQKCERMDEPMTEAMNREMIKPPDGGTVALLNVQSMEAFPVSGRELHRELKIGTQYSIWFGRMCDYGFESGEDFQAINQKRLTAQGNETEQIDHSMTIAMAKEVAMLQRTEDGKRVRRYLISVEEAWNTPELLMARALQSADNTIKKLSGNVIELTAQVQALKPKADYVDWILQNPGLVTITQIAKDYGMSGRAMNKLLHEMGVQYKQSGQWMLYTKYAGKGYVHSETFPITHKDGREGVTMETKWTQKGRMFLYEFLRDNENMLPLIERPQTA